MRKPDGVMAGWPAVVLQLRTDVGGTFVPPPRDIRETVVVRFVGRTPANPAAPASSSRKGSDRTALPAGPGHRCDRGPPRSGRRAGRTTARRRHVAASAPRPPRPHFAPRLAPRLAPK